LNKQNYKKVLDQIADLEKKLKDEKQLIQERIDLMEKTDLSPSQLALAINPVSSYAAYLQQELDIYKLEKELLDYYIEQKKE
jgi:hypothetical protein